MAENNYDAINELINSKCYLLFHVHVLDLKIDSLNESSTIREANS